MVTISIPADVARAVIAAHFGQAVSRLEVQLEPALLSRCAQVQFKLAALANGFIERGFTGVPFGAQNRLLAKLAPMSRQLVER